jgi:hypothetical protein
MPNLPHRTAIIFPSSDMVHAEFALSLAGLCNETPPTETAIVNVRSSIVAEARNNGVEMARTAGAGRLLFLDSDMVFPRSTLRRLLRHDRDIVGATYLKRTPPFAALGARHGVEAYVEGGGLLAMSYLPTGCLLIGMNVFEALSRPYFRYGMDPESGAIVGEDYDFCERARAAGFNIWCDSLLSYEVGHIGQTIHQIKAT